MGQGEGGERGQAPSTQHLLLRAFARRVDQVLMTTSPYLQECDSPLTGGGVVIIYLSLILIFSHGRFPP